MGVEERGPGVDLGLELRIGVLEAERADIEVLRHLSRERHDAREVAGPEPMRRKPTICVSTVRSVTALSSLCVRSMIWVRV